MFVAVVAFLVLASVVGVKGALVLVILGGALIHEAAKPAQGKRIPAARRRR